MNIQPRVRHGERGGERKQVSARANRAVRDAVERDAIRWGCSRSWIIHTALAAFYGIEIRVPVPMLAHARRRRAA